MAKRIIEQYGMNFSYISTYFRRWLVILSIVFTALAVVLFALNVIQQNQMKEAAFVSAQRQATEAAQQLDKTFGTASKVAAAIGADLSSGKLKYTDINQRLTAEMDSDSNIDGLAISFEPYVYDANTRLYTTYISHKESGGYNVLNGNTYDYTLPPSNDPGAPVTAWYHTSLKSGPIWLEPYVATGAGKTLIEHGLPFYRTDPTTNKQVPAGVVTLDYSLVGMSGLLSSLNLGTTGYGFVVSDSGTILAHPLKSAVGHNVRDKSHPEYDLPLWATQYWNPAQTSAYSFDTVMKLTGQPAWLFYEPIPSTNWQVGIVLAQSEFLPPPQSTVRLQALMALSVMMALFFLATLIFKSYLGTDFGLWAASISFAVLCVLVMIFIWTISNNNLPPEPRLTDESQVDRYLQKYQSVAVGNTNAPPTILIPTGIMVQALRFGDANTVNVNGLIWMHYPSTVPEDVVRGFNLPQLTSEQYTIQEVGRLKQGNEELITWSFAVILKGAFDPSKFPFDSRNIAIRIAPADTSGQLLLTPDLNAYGFINPARKPGLDAKAEINNWTINFTAFSFNPITSNSNFGVNGQDTVRLMPELYFQITTQRGFVSSFIAFIVPGLVAAFLLFAFLISLRVGESESKLQDTLNFSAALFFVIIIAHTSMRDSVAAVGIIYVGYLFIILYIAIVSININVFLIAKRPPIALIHYRDNLIAKLAYWPLIAGTMLAITLLLFVFN